MKGSEAGLRSTAFSLAGAGRLVCRRSGRGLVLPGVLSLVPSAAAAQEAGGEGGFAGVFALVTQHLPFDILSGVNTQEILIVALVVATVFCTVTGAAALVQTKRTLVTSRREHAAQVAELSARLERAEAMLGAETSVLIIWRDRGAPEVSGDHPRLPGVPRKPEELLDWSAWLSPESAEALGKACQRLVERGEACQLLVRSLDGNLSLEALGRIVAGQAVLRLRDVSVHAMENAHLQEEVRRLRHESVLSHTLLENLPTPVWLRGQDGRLRWANQAFVDMVECETLDEAVERNVWLVGEEELRALEEARGPDGFASLPIRFVSQGTQKLMHVFDLETHKGRMGLAVDISEADLLRKELERHIEAHKRTFDQLKSGIAIFAADQSLMFYNEAYQSLWQLDPEWLDTAPRESDILDKLRAAHRLPETPDFRGWRDKHLESYHTNETKRSIWYLPDGQTLNVISVPHPFGGVIYLYENETETLALQRGFNALEQTQRETLDNLREGVAVFGSNGRLSLYNPAFAGMWKLSGQALDNGPHIDEIIDWCRPLINASNVWHKVKEVVTAMEENRVRVEGELARSDGMVLDYVTVPLPGGSTLVTFVDVTAARNVANMLREKNEALQAADRIKSDFIQHVSYELRAPLTTVIGFTELLADEKSGPLTERQKSYAGHILSSSHVLMALIDDILDLASLDAGVVELERSKVDVPDIIGQVFETVAPKLQELNVSLEKHVADDLQPLHADPQRLKQVLYNLVSNAIAFSDFGQTVRVEVLNIGRCVAFKVIDEGTGMSEEERNRVFDRFFSTASTHAGRGAGLGLSIVKSFVELHGGTVSISSRPHAGTTVTCLFPADAEAGYGQLEEQPAE